MKIYDCFAFFNELDLLELRLEELSPVVDYFVVVEATRTFQKKPKPLYFTENKSRFKKFEDKIIHVVVDKYPTFWTKFRPVTTWHYDNHQKEGILQGIKDAGPEDLIIVSDLDEIPLAEKVLEYKNQKGIRVFEAYQSYYYLNYVCTHIYDYGGKAVAQRNRDGYGRWRGTVMLEKKLIKTIKETRGYMDEESSRIQVVQDGGWHFSYMGGIQKILEKIDAWTHIEFNNPEFNSKEKVIQNVLEGNDLFKQGSKYEIRPIDGELPFPSALKRHPEKWAHMLKTKAELEKELRALLEPTKAL